MTKKAVPKAEEKAPAPAFTEFQIGEVTVNVVPSFDDLPRRVRRKLRNLTQNYGVDAARTGGVIDSAGLAQEYAVIYAQSQGVIINLSEELPDEEAEVIERVLMLNGVRLMQHFRNAGGDEGKAEEPAEETETQDQ